MTDDGEKKETEAVAAAEGGAEAAEAAVHSSPSTSTSTSTVTGEATVAEQAAVVVEEAKEPPVPEAPETATVKDLQEAVGAKPRAERVRPKVEFAPVPVKPARAPRPARAAKPPGDGDDDELEIEGRPRRRWPLVLLGIFVVGATVTTFVLLGQANSQRYLMTCAAKQIGAERGRSFPPWGTEALDGAAWRPIEIPPNAECTPHETDDPAKLETWYLEALVEQATTKLTGDTTGDVDVAEKQLEQALLLTRSPERRDQRKEIERLLGDVTYWRAAAKVKAAVTALDEAARRFDDAAARRPRHASDAAAWADFARATAGALGTGPGGGGAPQTPPSGVPLPTRPLAPPGVALPVEEPSVPADAGVEAPLDAPASTLPTGGVLL